MRDESKTKDGEPVTPTPNPQQGAKRRPYAPPVLTRYGSVAKLTSTGTGGSSDGSMLMMSCL